MSTSNSAAAKCKFEPCNNSTVSVYCWLHWYMNTPGNSESVTKNRVQQLIKKAKRDSISPEVETERDNSNPTQLWSDVKKVFIDLTDEINPAGIRNQVRYLAEGVATTSALRFAKEERLEIDAKERDDHIDEFTSSMVQKLFPSEVDISQEDAEFIGGSVASDGLGGFEDFDDAKAVISYGLKKEWELAQAMKIAESADAIPYDIPFDKFMSVVYNNDIAPHVLSASKREASDFHANVVIATGSRAANPVEVNPKHALPARAETEPIESAYFNEAREWQAFNEANEEAQRKAMEEANIASEERMRQRTEAIQSAINGASNFVKTGLGAIGAADEMMNRLFRTRPEDIEADRKAYHKRNRDIYYEVATRRERRRRGMI